MNTKLVEMGTCRKPHGIKGGFLFHLYNIEDSQLKNGSTVKLIPFSEESSLDQDGEEFKIKTISVGNKTICYLEGIEDRNIVEAMIPFQIFFDRDSFADLEEDEVYLSDLEGIDVVNSEKEKVGHIKTFYDHGATPILVISLVDGETLELPFVEAFFPELNIDEEYIVMVNPEEM